MHYTPATQHDIDFITQAVFSAVKSGTDVLTYATLFEKKEQELMPLFKEMIEEDIAGQELWLSGFLIAKTSEGKPAATCCAWVEGDEGLSAMLTAQLISFAMGIKTYQKALEKHEIIESMRVDREEGALQIEHVYTDAAYRGQGLAAQVIEQQIQQYKHLQPEVKKAQIILFKTNQNAVNAYSKLGFTVAQEQHSTHPKVLNYFPADTRILMEKAI